MTGRQLPVQWIAVTKLQVEPDLREINLIQALLGHLLGFARRNYRPIPLAIYLFMHPPPTGWISDAHDWLWPS